MRTLCLSCGNRFDSGKDFYSWKTASCVCWEKYLLVKYKTTHLPLEYWNLTIKDFQNTDEDRLAYSTLISILKDPDKYFDKNVWFWFYSTQSSVGKTFFPCMILKELVQKFKPVSYIPFSTLILDGTTKEYFTELSDMFDLIIIDGIDFALCSDNTRFLNLFDWFIRLRNKPLILTSTTYYETWNNYLKEIFNRKKNLIKPVELLGSPIKYEIKDVYSDLFND